MMRSNAVAIEELVETLTEEDYNAALSYITYLSVSRKNMQKENAKETLRKIQAAFADDKGYASEEEMLSDMA
mgnify:FL=1